MSHPAAPQERQGASAAGAGQRETGRTTEDFLQPAMQGRSPGALYLMPNTLDFGRTGQCTSLQELLPLGVIRVAAGLTHWVAENAKSARAFLKRVDAVVPLAVPLQLLSIAEVPRPQKGLPRAVTSSLDPLMLKLLLPAMQGHDMGLISEAGLPAVADPGAALVQAAHHSQVRVVALPGASSLLLAVAASGLNGQSFAFVGYLPVESDARATRIKELEAASRRHSQTQLLIETPYRNQALLAALLANLHVSTRLSVSCGLTCPGGFTHSDTVSAWRSGPRVLPNDVPAVFALLGA